MDSKWLFVGLLGLVLMSSKSLSFWNFDYFSKQQVSYIESQPPSDCDKYRSPIDSTEYILQLSTKAMDKLNWSSNFTITNNDDFKLIVQDTIQKYLRKVFLETIKEKKDGKKNNLKFNKVSKVISGEKVKEICPCGSVLMGTEGFEDNPLLDFPDRTRQHTATLEPKSEGMFKAVGLNYIININPYKQRQALSADRCREPSLPNRTDNDKIKIAIIDSGIDMFHDGLKNNIWINKDETINIGSGIDNLRVDNDNNGIVDDLNGFNFFDFNNNLRDNTGHGTHIAGIINGNYENDYFSNENFDESIALMNLKITSSKSNYSKLFNAACALEYAIEEEVDIVNASWGYYSQVKHPVLENLINKATEKSIFIVAAAGNEGINIDNCKFWPASFARTSNNVVAIAAAGYINIPFWTNYGELTVNFAAQGDDILSTYLSEGCRLNSGSSMAAPAVSRYIAWLKFKEIEANQSYQKIWPDPKDKYKPDHKAVTLELSRGYNRIIGKLSNPSNEDFIQTRNESSLKNNIILKSKHRRSY